MSNAYLSPILQDAQFNDDGTFLVGGLIWFYEAGTSTPLLAYTTPVADTAWSNPIVLDARGETGGEIWLSAGKSYKIVLEGPREYGQTNGVVISTFDNITGVNDPGTTSIANWIVFPGTPTYLTADTFNVPGDYRTVFLESRRLKSTNTVGAVYSTVISSTYATGVTTVTVSNDYGQSLDAGMSAVSYGFIETGAISSIPVAVNAGSADGGSQYQMWIDYDGTNLKWAKDADVASSTWPINALTADNAKTNAFTVTGTTGQTAYVVASTAGVNDAYLYNNPNDWGILSSDGGPGINYNRASAKFSYGGFSFPTSAIPITIGLPNGMKLIFATGSASAAGVANTLPSSFTSSSTFITVGTPQSGAHADLSINQTAGNAFTAYSSATTNFAYIAVGY